ncbi:hypothetical protein MBLNU457_1784t1 [Dothideomycetes sp. NU457]
MSTLTNGTSSSQSHGSGNIGDLSGKVALITGASSGLGRAIAIAYAAAGAYVVCADLTPNLPNTPELQKVMKDADFKTTTVDLINKQHGPRDGKAVATYVQCNVTQATSMEAAVEATVQTHRRLDIMVNNAGIMSEDPQQRRLNRPARIHETDESVFDRGNAVNFKGVWLGMKYATAQMLKQDPLPSGDRGWIVNMASIFGLVATSGSSTYCGTKGGVVQMTRAVALEYAADRIHVNCVCPAAIETALFEGMRSSEELQAGVDAWVTYFHPWGRKGYPEEVAKVALFLAGPGASYVTGAAYEVSGGYTAQ